MTDKSREREPEKKHEQPSRTKEDKQKDIGIGKWQPGSRPEEVSETRPPPTKRDKTE